MTKHFRNHDHPVLRVAKCDNCERMKAWAEQMVLNERKACIRLAEELRAFDVAEAIEKQRKP